VLGENEASGGKMVLTKRGEGFINGRVSASQEKGENFP
jgi:hypothetical protein